MRALLLCHPMVGGIFRKSICRRGYSKKFAGEEILRSFGAGELKYVLLFSSQFRGIEVRHRLRES